MKKKILIIEDEIIIAMGTKNNLIKLGYEVTAMATTYEDALVSVQNEMPDLVLADINLGKGKKCGIETAADIQKIKSIPIIYLTSYVDDDTLNNAKLTNPVGYITKPYKVKQLKSMLSIAFSKSVIEDKKNLLLEQIRKDSEKALSDITVLSEHIDIVFSFSNEMDSDQLMNFLSLIKRMIRENVKFTEKIFNKLDLSF